MTDPSQRFVPAARFLKRAEAWPLAGLLQSEGIDAKVVRQQESIYGYEPDGGNVLSVYMVIVPERDGARAQWILAQFGDDSASADERAPGTLGTEGP